MAKSHLNRLAKLEAANTTLPVHEDFLELMELEDANDTEGIADWHRRFPPACFETPQIKARMAWLEKLADPDDASNGL